MVSPVVPLSQMRGRHKGLYMIKVHEQAASIETVDRSIPDFISMEVFQQVPFRPGLDRLKQIFFIIRNREHHHLCFRQLLLQYFFRFQPVPLGHVNIKQNQIRLGFFGNPDRLNPIIRFPNHGELLTI